MSNVLNEEQKQQVIALGRLGWSLRRIERETSVRRETVSAYLKEAGVALRPPRGRRIRAKPASRTGEVPPDSTPAKPASQAEEVTPDSGGESAGGSDAKPTPKPERSSSVSFRQGCVNKVSATATVTLGGACDDKHPSSERYRPRTIAI